MDYFFNSHNLMQDYPSLKTKPHLENTTSMFDCYTAPTTPLMSNFYMLELTYWKIVTCFIYTLTRYATELENTHTALFSQLCFKQ